MFSLTHRESGIKVAMKEVKMEPQYSKMPEVSHFTKITIFDYYKVFYLAAKMSPLKIAAKNSYRIVLCSNLWLLWNVVLTLLYKTPPTAATSKILL